jgi:hypothetical protein
MSIYHARRKQPGAAKQPDPARKGETKDAVEFDAAPSDQAPANMAWLRRANPANYMLPATVNWFEALPPELRPIALAMQYARIANLLAQQWNDEKACSAYFDDLLMGRRAKRRGFPPNVRRELWQLREYYQRRRLTTDGQLAIV